MRFCDYTDSYVDDIENSIQGVVFRTALIAFRMMMILSAIRMMDEGAPSCDHGTGHLVCSDADYQTVMLMMEALIKHTVHQYCQLSKTIASAGGTIAARRLQVLSCLPDEFTKHEFADAADRLHFRRSTADKWIPKLIELGCIERTDHGVYRKCSTHTPAVS